SAQIPVVHILIDEHFFTDYGSLNGRYHLFANATWNAFKNQFNGGITSDTVFIDQKVNNRDLRGLPVQLSAAGNRYREKSFQVSNYFRLDRPSDSSLFQPGLFFSSTYRKGSSTYFDKEKDSAAIYQYYYDGLTSYDSVGYKDWRNKGGIDLVLRTESKLLR
ncbi:MAG: putative porin, partial [Flavobacteriales bacterium]